MNPDVKVEASKTKVGPETELFWSPDFFRGLDGVCNALDNVNARLYMDSKCVFFKKPLLESGTSSTLLPLIPLLFQRGSRQAFRQLVLLKGSPEPGLFWQFRILKISSSRVPFSLNSVM